VRFEVADGWDTNTIGALAVGSDDATQGSWDCLFVDVGGLSGPDGFLEAVALLRQVYLIPIHNIYIYIYI